MAGYHIGDARGLKEIFILNGWGAPQIIISSPPYWSLKNYGSSENQIGHGQPYDEFLEDTAKVFVDCYDISRDNATLWIIVDTCMDRGEIKTIPFDITNKMKEKGGKKRWILKDIIVWNRPKGVVSGLKRFKNSFEYILMFSKGEKYVFNADNVRDTLSIKKWWVSYPERYNPSGKKLENVWEFMPPMRGWGPSHQKHLCPLPFGMMDLIIEIFTNVGDIVFDPFAGSGTVLAIADAKERKGVGIDINEGFEDVYKNSVSKAAKKFVEERDKETKLLEERKQQFAAINKKLRAMKLVGLMIEDFVKEVKPTENIVKFAKYKPNKKTLELIIYSDEKLEKYTMSENIVNLRRQSKIDISIRVESLHKLPLDNGEVYIYHTRKTNKFDVKTTKSAMHTQKGDSNSFFSDLFLNISSSESILNKDLSKLHDSKQKIELKEKAIDAFQQNDEATQK